MTRSLFDVAGEDDGAELCDRHLHGHLQHFLATEAAAGKDPADPIAPVLLVALTIIGQRAVPEGGPDADDDPLVQSCGANDETEVADAGVQVRSVAEEAVAGDGVEGDTYAGDCDDAAREQQAGDDQLLQGLVALQELGVERAVDGPDVRNQDHQPCNCCGDRQREYDMHLAIVAGRREGHLCR